MRLFRALPGTILTALALAALAKGCSPSEGGTHLDEDGLPDASADGGGDGPDFWDDDASAGDSGGSGGSDWNGNCSPACESDEVCSHGTCIPLLPCETDSDCKNDTRCRSEERRVGKEW